jgi:sugar/nucleoside kinase (ribokinase family)
MPDEPAPPVLVGTVALDVLHAGLVGSNLPAVRLRWGGVISNMACAMGVLGAHPRFVSTDYYGEMREAIAGHLAGNGVHWEPLTSRAPIPLFHARGAGERVYAEHFIGPQAVQVLTPGALRRRPHVFDSASAIVSCTDLPMAGLSWLGRVAAGRRVPFWLLAADTTEAGKLRRIHPPPDCVGLNLAELTGWLGRPVSLLSEAVEALRRLLRPEGRAVLTLGAAGALLVSAEQRHAGHVHHQPAPPMGAGSPTVGAGDVLFGCLLAARLAGAGWADALWTATARTAAYLATPHTATRPYLSLLSPRQTPKGRRLTHGELDSTLPPPADLGGGH